MTEKADPGRNSTQEDFQVRIGLALIVSAAAIGAALWAGPAAATVEDLVLQGRVTDDGGIGLGGITVRAFINGFEKATAITGGDGAYILNLRYDNAEDQTIVVWWIPMMQTQVPELAILREGSRARELQIWSPCIPRLDLRPSVTHDVVLLQEAEKFRRLGADDCLR